MGGFAAAHRRASPRWPTRGRRPASSPARTRHRDHSPARRAPAARRAGVRCTDAAGRRSTVAADIVVVRRRPAPHRDRAAARPSCARHPERVVAAPRRRAPARCCVCLGVRGRAARSWPTTTCSSPRLGGQLRPHLRPDRARPGPGLDLRLQAERDRPGGRPGGRREPVRARAGAGRRAHRAAAGRTAQGDRRSSASPTRRSTRSPPGPASPTCAERDRGAPHRRARGLRSTTCNAWQRQRARARRTRCGRAPSSRPGNRIRQGRRAALRGRLHASRASALPMCLISAELVVKRLRGDDAGRAAGARCADPLWSGLPRLPRRACCWRSGLHGPARRPLTAVLLAGRRGAPPSCSPRAGLLPGLGPAASGSASSCTRRDRRS